MTISGWKLLPLAAAFAWTGPSRTTSTLVISATADSTSPNAPFSAVATSGTLLADGQTHRASMDTVHVLRTAELTTRDPIVTPPELRRAP